MHVVQKNYKIKTAEYLEVIITHFYINNNLRFAAKHVINLTYLYYPALGGSPADGSKR